MFGQSGMQFEPSNILQLQQKRLLYKQLDQTSKKLVLVLATSTPMTEASKKDVVI